MPFENISKAVKVQHIVRHYLADNRDAEEGIADRVIMGYLKDTYKYLSKALRILKPSGGIIHYHENCPNEIMLKLFDKVKNLITEIGKSAVLLELRKVKSYAPGVTHVVLDLKIE